MNPTGQPAAVPTQAVQPALADRAIVQETRDRFGSLLLVAVAAVASLLPLSYVLRQPFNDGLEGLRAMFDQPGFGTTLTTTLALGLGSVAVSTVVGTVLAWFSSSLPRGRRWLAYIPLVPLITPTLAVVTGYVFLFSPRVGFGNQFLRSLPIIGSDGNSGPFNVYSIPWMITVTSLNLTSFVFMFVRSAVGQLHQDLFDAAATSGASSLKIFLKIAVPLLRPAIIYGAMTVALLSLGQFTVPLFLGRQQNINVLATDMFRALTQFPPSTALAASYGLPIVVAGLLFIVLQRTLLRDQSRFSTGGARGARALKDCGLGGQLTLAIYGLLAVVLPISALVVVALQPQWSATIDPSEFTLANIRVVLDTPPLLGGVRNSLTYALITVLITIPLGYACAERIYRRSQRPILANALDVLVSLPVGIPAVIFGMGFLLAYTVGPLPLYGRSIGVVVVYIVLLLPFTTRMLLVAMTALGADLANAAAVSGAGRWRQTFLINAPLIRPALGAAMALIFIITTHEFSASLLIRTTNTQVVGTVMYDLWTFGSYPQAAVLALFMCVVTGAGVVLATVIGGRGALSDAANR